MIAEFITLNLQGSIDQKLDSIDWTTCKFIFFAEFPIQSKPSLTCKVLCFTQCIEGKTLITFFRSLMSCVLNLLWDLKVFTFIHTFRVIKIKIHVKSLMIFVRDYAPDPLFMGCWAKPMWMGGVVLLPLKMEVRLVIFSPLD